MTIDRLEQAADLDVISSTASTFVVSPAGSDANPGTAAQPFATIGRAARSAGPGDRILAKGGIYRETIVLPRSGSHDAPISFVADPPGSVVVTGADVVAGFRSAHESAPIYEIPWGHVFARKSRDGGSAEYHTTVGEPWGRAEQIIADGRDLLPVRSVDSLIEAWQVHVEAAHGDAPAAEAVSPLPNLGGPFAGYFFADTFGKKLYIVLADGSDPAQHTVEASTRQRVVRAEGPLGRGGVEHVHMRGFVFRYAASFPQEAAVSIPGRNNLIDNCVIEQMAGAGVRVNGVMRRTSIRGCGHIGGSAWGNGYLNERNIWEGNSWKPIDRDWESGGLKSVFNKGGIFRECAFIRNGGDGLWFDINERDALVTNCVFYGNEHCGLYIEISKDIRAIDNLCIANGVGVVGVPHGRWACAGITIAESEDCLVEGNTCVGNKDGIAFREIGPRDLPAEIDSDETIYYRCKGDVVRNNICAFNVEHEFAYWSDNAYFGPLRDRDGKYKTEVEYTGSTPQDTILDPRKQGLAIDNNLYFCRPEQRPFLYGVPWREDHETFADLGSFTAKTGFDPHSRFGDPRFVDAAKSNFRLKSGSPANEMHAGLRDAPEDIDVWIAGLRDPEQE